MSRQNVVPGTDITFTVVATGSNLAYQWQRNGEDLSDDAKYSGTDTTTLTVMDVMEADEGSFTCVVTDGVNNDTSNAAQLTVRKCVYVYSCVCNLVPTIQLVVAYGMQKQKECLRF